MRNHVRERIASLRSLISKGLFQDNLSPIIQHCGALVQDSPHTLVFFTLKHIFIELDQALDTEKAVEISMFNALTQGIAEQTSLILEKLERGGSIEPSVLERLVSTHISNLALFRS